MLRCRLDVGSRQAKPHLPFRLADPLNRGGRKDVARLVEMMGEIDDEVTLAGRVRGPGALAGISVGGLDAEAFEAALRVEHSAGERPEPIRLVFGLAHSPVACS